MSFNSRRLAPAVMVATLLFSRQWFEASMAMHMAVQLPMLVLVGVLFSRQLHLRYPGTVRLGQRYRVSLLLFALFTFSLWMLPRLLDAAVLQAGLAIMKWLSLPLAGMALVLSWRHLPFVLRGVLHLEALATLLRLGWLYLIAPQRYCVSYGMDDQRQLGYVLLSYAAVYAIYLTGRIMLGATRPAPADV